MKKRKMKISTKIIFYLSIITIFIAIIFYFALPNLLNYSDDTINTEFDKKVSGLYYVEQYIAAVVGILILFIIFFKLSLKKIDNWVAENKASEVEQIRKFCFTYPLKLFLVIETFPVSIVFLVLTTTGSHELIFLFKICILVFTFATLVGSLFLIVSKIIFYPILSETSNYSQIITSTKEKKLISRLIIQIFPCILTSILLIVLIAYSRLIAEKDNLIHTYYIAELSYLELNNTEDLLGQVESQLGEYLLSENDFIFIETPSGEILTSNGETLSDFFLEYMHVLSASHNNSVYESYAVDERGVISYVEYKGETYIVGIHYEIVAFSLLPSLMLSSILLLIFDLFVLYFMFRSINTDLLNVTNGMKNILQNKSYAEIQKLPVTSNDIVGELVKTFNGIQVLNQENISKIYNSQNMLMERERLASLGQLISGIAHNLKSPIMSISGAVQGLDDLVNEFDNSIGNPIVNDSDFHDIAKDMREWLNKINSYTEYMSDVITAVKGQAVNLSNNEEMYFTIGELFKTVNILMKHELKQSVTYLVMSMQIDENTQINGNVNSLVQVINNMISNSIQAYNGKKEQEIDLIATKENNNLIITIKDFGPGLPEGVKDKLFKEMVTTKGKNGTGLGLYMSYSTIKGKFNGEITVETSENKGTAFHIIIPL